MTECFIKKQFFHMQQVCLPDKHTANLHFWSLFPSLKTVNKLFKFFSGFVFFFLFQTLETSMLTSTAFSKCAGGRGGLCLEGGSSSLSPFLEALGSLLFLL